MHISGVVGVEAPRSGIGPKRIIGNTMKLRNLLGYCAVAAGVFSATIVAAPNSNPGIVPVNSNPHGRSYGEWAVAWWQWALGIPEAQNPVVDTTGQYAGVGQSGSVWFLAGTFGGNADRNVTVPSGKAIFVPVHNWIFGAGVFDCQPTVPGVTCDVPTLQAAAAARTEAAETVRAWIDGVAVANIRSYRAASPEPFSITLPTGAVFGLDAGTYYPQVADGYWLMLAPLSKGDHSIRVRCVNTVGGVDQTLNIHLTVE
jgi:hypothetical protein